MAREFVRADEEEVIEARELPPLPFETSAPWDYML